MALLRRVRSVHAVAIAQPGPRLGQIAMPDLVRSLPHRDARLGLARLGVEEAELDALGMLGEQCEVDAFSVPSGAERVRPPGPDARIRVDHAILRTTRGCDGCEEEVTSITPCGDT